MISLSRIASENRTISGPPSALLNNWPGSILSQQEQATNSSDHSYLMVQRCLNKIREDSVNQLTIIIHFF